MPHPHIAMTNVTGILAALGTIFFCTIAPVPAGDRLSEVTIGLQPDGSVLVPTNQVLRPAGTQITFPGRPVDLALLEDGKTLVVKNLRDLVFIDVAAGKIKQILELDRGRGPEPIYGIKALTTKPIGADGKQRAPYGDGFSVVGLVTQGRRVYVTDALNRVQVALRQQDGTYAWTAPLELAAPKVGGSPNPAGMAFVSADRLWVTTTRGNDIHLIDLVTKRVQETVPVGVAPYMVAVARPDRCYVTNWGGEAPTAGQSQALSSGTPTRTDPRTGIASTGTVSVLRDEEGHWRQVKTIPVGLHPAGMVLGNKRRLLYVANANSDTVSVIDTMSDAVVETIPCRPETRLPFGSGANALALSPDGNTLYVANGTNNCIAVVRLGAQATEATTEGRPAQSGVAGLVPTAWYPGAVRLSPDGKNLFVANVKGLGALARLRPLAQGKNTHDFLGSVSIIEVPDDAQLAKYTEQVNANNRLAYSIAGLEKPRAGIRPVPVPQRHGEPSVFKHVVYVIKENRSYDQVLGDMKEGNGDPSLCLFGEDVTPNQHKLAREFTLFDNFYCSSTLSATGHQWVNEAYVVDYLTKTFGGFVRSYPCDGDDPLAFASSGFLWDNALSHGKTFRNFGEFTKSTYSPKTATWTDVYNDYKSNTRAVKITVEPNVKPMGAHTHPGYPGFPLVTPDVYRAQLFLEELKIFEQRGEFPNLVYLYLPANHTVGTRPGFPTPRAMVADNDLALGRVVEAITRSRFWKDTCLFVVEDDPQFGFDHVDGHRSVAQVISPYTRRKYVDHANFNQTGMVKTIELVLGLPPMNQLDLSATPMRNCFQAEPDMTPFASVPNRIPLDRMNSGMGRLDGKALYWARKSLELDLDEADDADEETFNRILWHSVRGAETPYPEHLLHKQKPKG
jgi:YVTN family beta-propeller protein